MSNTLVTPTKIAKESLMLLKNSLQMGRRVHREYKSEMFDPKSGGAITIRKPVEFSVTSGAILSNQNISELTLTIEQFSKRYIVPAVAQLANQVDYDGLGLYDDVANSVGTPGTTPNAFSSISAAAQRLDEIGVENSDRHLLIDPAARWSMADALKGLYSTNLTEDAIRRGDVGNIGMFDIAMTQNVNTHTTGTYSTGSTPLVNGASSAGDLTLVTDGWANSTTVLKAGDVFTVSNSGTSIKEVNPRNKQSTGVAKQFVALSDVTSDGSGNATITVYDSNPGMQASGAYQNMSALPANNATISVWGADGGMSGAGSEATTYPMNLAFHRDAFALCFFNIEMPQSADGYTASDPDSGIAVRVIRDYDVTNDREVYRLDVLYSWKTIYPMKAVRLVG